MTLPGFATVQDLGGGLHYEVHLAYDHHRRTPVVVKAVRPELLEDDAVLAGFAREVDVLSRLSHPSIVRLLEWDDEPRPYMVLEHLDGPTLSSLISQHGPTQLHQLIATGIELTSAVAYLHAEGLVHLDIKPSNVVMGAPATLLDLSLALDAGEAAALDHPVGTDQYMAPEQCLPGELGQVGPAADVWGIGATLFRAAAGVRAWPTVDDGHPQLTHPPRALPDFVPPAVRDLITDAMAPMAQDRPTPDELLARLEPLMGALPKARLSGFKVKL